jgi:hypothetical protein
MSNTFKDDPDFDSMKVKKVKRSTVKVQDFDYMSYSDADPGL